MQVPVETSKAFQVFEVLMCELLPFYNDAEGNSCGGDNRYFYRYIACNDLLDAKRFMSYSVRRYYNLEWVEVKPIEGAMYHKRGNVKYVPIQVPHCKQCNSIPLSYTEREDKEEFCLFCKIDQMKNKKLTEDKPF